MPFDATPPPDPKRTEVRYVKPGHGFVDTGPQTRRSYPPRQSVATRRDEYMAIVESAKQEIAAERQGSVRRELSEDDKAKFTEYNRLINEEHMFAKEALKAIGISRGTLSNWRKKLAEEKKSDIQES